MLPRYDKPFIVNEQTKGIVLLPNSSFITVMNTRFLDLQIFLPQGRKLFSDYRKYFKKHLRFRIVFLSVTKDLKISL